MNLLNSTPNQTLSIVAFNSPSALCHWLIHSSLSFSRPQTSPVRELMKFKLGYILSSLMDYCILKIYTLYLLLFYCIYIWKYTPNWSHIVIYAWNWFTFSCLHFIEVEMLFLTCIDGNAYYNLISTNTQWMRKKYIKVERSFLKCPYYYNSCFN